jgi:hypothetical protein
MILLRAGGLSALRASSNPSHPDAAQAVVLLPSVLRSAQNGVCLKISEPKLHLGSAGGILPKPPFHPPRLACTTEAVRRREAEAKRTISSFSRAVAL